MAQVRANGAVEDGQFLTADLSYFEFDSGSSATNVSSYGYTAGVKNPGEKLVHLVQTVGSPVIIENSNARITWMAIEAAPGITAADLQTTIRTDSAFTNATVTAGTFSITT